MSLGQGEGVRTAGGPAGDPAGDPDDVDVVVVGAGHNGLVAAGLLARAGLLVRVLERRSEVGGFAGLIEVRDGLRVPIAADDWGLLRADLLAELLPELGDSGREGEVDRDGDADQLFALAVDGRGGSPVALWRDVARTADELATRRASDGTGWRGLIAEVSGFGRELEERLRAAPAFEDLGRMLANADLVRALALPVADRVLAHLEDGVAAAALATLALAGSTHGPAAAGTGWLLQAQLAGSTAQRLRPLRRAGGHGEPLAIALAHAATRYGARIETGRSVEAVLTERAAGGPPRAIGVRLADGAEIRCRHVLSNLDPRSTLLGLVGPQRIEVSTLRELRAARYRGVRSRLLLVVEERGLEGAPAGWLGSGARLVVGADLGELDHAAGAAKYGRCSERPAIEVFEGASTDGTTALLVNAQWSPYRLRPETEPDGGWDGGARRAWQEAILARLEQALPALGEGLLARRLLTPVDWERELGASEGSDSHGEMALEQMFSMRGVPLAGGGPATGVEGLLLCGAGAHPGGALTGLPGWHAARAVLAERAGGAAAVARG